MHLSAYCDNQPGVVLRLDDVQLGPIWLSVLQHHIYHHPLLDHPLPELGGRGAHGEFLTSSAMNIL